MANLKTIHQRLKQVESGLILSGVERLDRLSMERLSDCIGDIKEIAEAEQETIK